MICASVCLSVCLRANLWKYLSDLTNFLRVTYGHGFILLRQHCDMLGTSDLVDDICLCLMTKNRLEKHIVTVTRQATV